MPNRSDVKRLLLVFAASFACVGQSGTVGVLLDSGASSEWGGATGTESTGTGNDGTGDLGGHEETTGSGTTDDGDPGMPEVGRCVPAWLDHRVMLDEIEAVTELNSSDYESDPRTTEDGLTIYFVTRGNIHVARRSDLTARFESPQPLVELNTEFGESAFFTTADGTWGFFASDRPGGPGHGDLWMAHREDPSGMFSPPRLIAELSTEAMESDVFPSGDGLRLYFNVNAPEESLMAKPWVAERSSLQDAFGPPRRLEGLESLPLAANPTLTRDELVVVFTSISSSGADDFDLWYATRSRRSDLFGEPRPIPGVNSAHHENEPFLRADGCELYFTSDRPGTMGGWDIHRAQVIVD